MKLIWLVDDVAEPPLRAEHGVAFWIATAQGRVLFDTGSSGSVLLHNAAKLSVDLSTADAVVLSHAHDDHTGGLPAVLPLLRPEVPLYANPTIFRPRYSNSSGEMLSRGMPLSREELAPHPLRLSDQPQEVLPGVWTSGVITERPQPEGRSSHHFVREGGAYRPDPYQDDLSLVLETSAGLVLVCGCCHAGLLNTIAHVRRHWRAPIIGIAGGLHLRSAAPAVIRRTVASLASLPALRWVRPGHCSGAGFSKALRHALGVRYLSGTVGDCLADIVRT